MLEDKQNGFRKGRSTMEPIVTIVTIRSIVETLKTLRKSTSVAFLDFMKAYDCIIRYKMWTSLL